MPRTNAANFESGEGVAVNVTFVCGAKYGGVHVVPQLIPSGDEVTVPLPVPSLVTLSWNGGVWASIAGGREASDLGV